MANTDWDIRLKKGQKSNLPIRADLAEPLYTTDTGELFIGRGENLPPRKVGMTDYEVWLEQGNTGAIEDFYGERSRHLWQQADW